MSKREPNPEVQSWCLEKLAEIDSIQQQLHGILDRRAKRRDADVTQKSGQAVGTKPVKSKAPLKNERLLSAIPVPNGSPKPKITQKGEAAATLDPCHLPPVHQTRAQFWQERNKAASKAYKNLTDEEKQARARALKEEYEAEMERLCL